MRFTLPRLPECGEQRVVKKFAWIPVHMRDDDYILWETYWSKQMFKELWISRRRRWHGRWVETTRAYKEKKHELH